MAASEHADVLRMTVQIVSAHAARNSISADELPPLIRAVYAALAGAPRARETTAAKRKWPDPAGPIKRSVFPDYIVCLEDGRKLKMLRRHLANSHGLTTAEYRAKWDLPTDYPVVAPSYAEKRSELAKQIGLGRKPKATSPEPTVRKVPAGVSGQRRRRSRKVAQASWAPRSSAASVRSAEAPFSRLSCRRLPEHRVHLAHEARQLTCR